ncbi:hypothetical protein [Leptolyngbya sp. O-77]|uniref:hypothetical protein n=1 Tax=Leptolyngbya sp. O-77 TaxID=1080068 RepID=UPI00074D3E7C|nr:hypothetical protein [Leptolyngbya sp. O-77]BAU44635.1 hypothetical protein O77CONTIG1_04480 [Leptolyngbya sp. O-77]
MQAHKKGCLILEKEGKLQIEAIDNNPDQTAVVFTIDTPGEQPREVPVSLIHLGMADAAAASIVRRSQRFAV